MGGPGSGRKKGSIGKSSKIKNKNNVEKKIRKNLKKDFERANEKKKKWGL